MKCSLSAIRLVVIPWPCAHRTSIQSVCSRVDDGVDDGLLTKCRLKVEQTSFVSTKICSDLV